jgi:hypothetical protein
MRSPAESNAASESIRVRIPSPPLVNFIVISEEHKENETISFTLPKIEDYSI